MGERQHQGEGACGANRRGATASGRPNVGWRRRLAICPDVPRARLAVREDAKAKEGEDATCQVTNILFPKGYTFGGSRKAILSLKEAAEANGALQVRLLNWSGAFHTPLMRPALQRLSAALDEVASKMSPPRCAIYMNATGRPVPAGGDCGEIIENLKAQLTSNVLWEPTMRLLIENGATEFYEVGPMNQLKSIMKRIDIRIWRTTHDVDV
eukprot:NODE_13723_length_1150_cov_5.178886.p1 GENE.NODE_13723_length_1150_cov_5.178886~~NODE_13723_length_1150_cov_5.178886.p1  ORF type:complete len:211 (+),score=50.53 NODE_13723_length_1150_cov_5.178886:194-826(+)